MLEDIEKYLPKYLSPPEQAKLFEELAQFPENIHNRLYTSKLDGDPVIFQGDGLSALPFIELPSTDVYYAKVIVISNTCDIAQNHSRFVPARIMYCPLIRLQGYRESLIQAYPDQVERIDSHVESVRRQECSSMFYLPAGMRLQEERIALLDRIVHHRMDQLDTAELLRGRLFTLSDYGFYLFLYKISIHFTRLREAVVRGYSD